MTVRAVRAAPGARSPTGLDPALYPTSQSPSRRVTLCLFHVPPCRTCPHRPSGRGSAASVGDARASGHRSVWAGTESGRPVFLKQVHSARGLPRRPMRFASWPARACRRCSAPTHRAGSCCLLACRVSPPDPLTAGSCGGGTLAAHAARPHGSRDGPHASCQGARPPRPQGGDPGPSTWTRRPEDHRSHRPRSPLRIMRSRVVSSGLHTTKLAVVSGRGSGDRRPRTRPA